MKRLIYNLAIFICLQMATASCKDYLDLVPDNIPTIDDAFSTRVNAERYLFTCFHFIPNMAGLTNNPAILGGDDMWANDLATGYLYYYCADAFSLAYGLQTPAAPIMNYWDGADLSVGGKGGTNLWRAIRHCNIFLDNIDKPYDLEQQERDRWIAEVKFLKAYYYFFLFRLYGPIPILDKNIPVSASPDEVRVYRNTTDEVVDYICKLLDEAKVNLPLKIADMANEAGRPTQTIALALKAKVLTLAASPLFNGNKDYVGYKDNRGVNIFGDNVGTVDLNKWQKAATAIKNAIDTCHLAENSLYKYHKVYSMSDTTVQKLTLRCSVTDKWNQEIIWGYTGDISMLTGYSMPRFTSGLVAGGNNSLGMTLNACEEFYSSHGVPIDEDKTWDYENRYKTRVGTRDYRYYIKEGETTANINFDREPRYYAAIGFDRGIWEGSGITDDTKSYYLMCHSGEATGEHPHDAYTLTCIFDKKICHYESAWSHQELNDVRYSYPYIRLADLYLLYAEVLNEIKPAPDAEVYKWIDLVRARAGLDGVVESWANYSSNPTKPLTQMGMRQIIHQERINEFMGEFQKYWDLVRWKEASKEYNRCQIKGWNYKGDNTEDFYKVTTYDNHRREFTTKDYLWPLSNNAILVNPNLVQNPGW